jgi:methanogenic corrinoid protein MtbC1
MGLRRPGGTFRAGEQMKPVLSTRDLSRIFQVNESSVKRWADLGVLHCFRTPGGHRKFTVEEVLRFAREQKFVLDDDALRILGVSGQFSRSPAPNEIEALGDQLFDALTQQNSDAGSRLLLEAHASHLPVETICDSLIRPTLDRLGTLRQSGQIEQFEERIATSKLVDALVRLSDAIGPTTPAPVHALLACVPGEPHDIDLRCMRLVLQRHGWRLTFLGGTIQAGSIETAIRRLKPQAVFVAASVSSDRLGWMLDSIGSAAREVGARLVIGGRGFERAGSLGTGRIDLLARSYADVDAFAGLMARQSLD